MKLDKKLSPAVKRRTITRLEKELTKMFSSILEADEMKLAEGLISEVVFMKVTLHDLKIDIIEIGSVYEFENGSQKMLRENPSQKTYSALITKYEKMLDSLIKLLPKKETNKDNSVVDTLDKFLGGMM